jgi:hypothetical protein
LKVHSVSVSELSSSHFGHRIYSISIHILLLLELLYLHIKQKKKNGTVTNYYRNEQPITVITSPGLILPRALFKSAWLLSRSARKKRNGA